MLLKRRGLVFAILNGCCHNNLECRKICSWIRRKCFSMFDSSEIDWFYRDYLQTNSHVRLKITYFPIVYCCCRISIPILHNSYIYDNIRDKFIIGDYCLFYLIKSGRLFMFKKSLNKKYGYIAFEYFHLTLL